MANPFEIPTRPKKIKAINGLSNKYKIIKANNKGTFISGINFLLVNLSTRKPDENKVIIDDEADYASPNAKINKVDDEGEKERTKINDRIFNLLKNDKLDKDNDYFEVRSKRAKIIRSRSNFNFFAFHFSITILQNIRNLFLKFLVKRKFFVKRYLGKVYKN